ncbi:MAG: hypothetical protein OXF73_00020, partial [Gammaproteobacteria bacterium]|nr:hypothetical protein [Gammaproteobacteria bacterium]
ALLVCENDFEWKLLQPIVEDTKPKTMPKRANGGYARASSVSSERRQEIARTAAAARWGS